MNFVALVCVGQTIMPQVINSGGKTTTATLNSQTVIYTDNIGEAIIGTGTGGGKMLTQGFLQPLSYTVNGGVVTTFTSDVSCADKRDGVIRVIISNLYSNATVQYFWKPSSLCPANNCSRQDSLSKGTFTVLTVIRYTVGSSPRVDSVTNIVTIKDEAGPCFIKPYTGIVLSGDNNHFVIDNIELYPEANVCIFNRWGNQIFCTYKYSNVDNFWPRKGEKVLPGTYFFIIDAKEKGVIKKWLEVFE
jgi:hypothetical protein